MRTKVRLSNILQSLGTILMVLCIGRVFGFQSQPKEYACIKCQALDLQKAPRYRIARRIKTVDGKTIIHISIDKNRFTPQDLSRLACRLGRDFREGPNILVLIFDNYQSAKRYVPRWAQEKPKTWQRDEQSQRASYIRDAEKGMHSIAWYADPLNKTGETRVNICNAK